MPSRRDARAVAEHYSLVAQMSPRSSIARNTQLCFVRLSRPIVFAPDAKRSVYRLDYVAAVWRLRENEIYFAQRHYVHAVQTSSPRRTVPTTHLTSPKDVCPKPFVFAPDARLKTPRRRFARISTASRGGPGTTGACVPTPPSLTTSAAPARRRLRAPETNLFSPRRPAQRASRRESRVFRTRTCVSRFATTGVLGGWVPGAPRAGLLSRLDEVRRNGTWKINVFCVFRRNSTAPGRRGEVDGGVVGVWQRRGNGEVGARRVLE